MTKKIPILRISIISIFILCVSVFIYQSITNKSIFSLFQPKAVVTKLYISPEQIGKYVDSGLSLAERSIPLFVSIVPTIYLIKDHKKKRNKSK